MMRRHRQTLTSSANRYAHDGQSFGQVMVDAKRESLWEGKFELRLTPF
jgi:hypothetical protein